MYFDLLLFFFPFLVHKELIKTHLTQSQSKTPQMRDEMGTEIHPGSHSGEIPPALLQRTLSSSQALPLVAHPTWNLVPTQDPCPHHPPWRAWLCPHAHLQSQPSGAHPMGDSESSSQPPLGLPQPPRATHRSSAPGLLLLTPGWKDKDGHLAEPAPGPSQATHTCSTPPFNMVLPTQSASALGRPSRTALSTRV